jgi:hypothetical protein
MVQFELQIARDLLHERLTNITVTDSVGRGFDTQFHRNKRIGRRQSHEAHILELSPFSHYSAFQQCNMCLFAPASSRSAWINGIGLRHLCPSVHHLCTSVRHDCMSVHLCPSVHHLCTSVRHDCMSVHLCPSVHHLCPSVRHDCMSVHLCPSVHHLCTSVRHDCMSVHLCPSVHHLCMFVHHLCTSVHHLRQRVRVRWGLVWNRNHTHTQQQ